MKSVVMNLKGDLGQHRCTCKTAQVETELDGEIDIKGIGVKGWLVEYNEKRGTGN